MLIWCVSSRTLLSEIGLFFVPSYQPLKLDASKYTESSRIALTNLSLWAEHSLQKELTFIHFQLRRMLGPHLAPPAQVSGRGVISLLQELHRLSLFLFGERAGSPRGAEQEFVQCSKNFPTPQHRPILQYLGGRRWSWSGEKEWAGVKGTFGGGNTR